MVSCHPASAPVLVVCRDVGMFAIGAEGHARHKPVRCDRCGDGLGSRLQVIARTASADIQQIDWPPSRDRMICARSPDADHQGALDAMALYGRCCCMLLGWWVARVDVSAVAYDDRNVGSPGGG